MKLSSFYEIEKPSNKTRDRFVCVASTGDVAAFEKLRRTKGDAPATEGRDPYKQGGLYFKVGEVIGAGSDKRAASFAVKTSRNNVSSVYVYGDVDESGDFIGHGDIRLTNDAILFVGNDFQALKECKGWCKGANLKMYIANGMKGYGELLCKEYEAGKLDEDIARLHARSFSHTEPYRETIDDTIEE